MDGLNKHFEEKLHLTEKALSFLDPDANLKETLSTNNSNFLLLAEIKQKMLELSSAVDQWKKKVDNAEVLTQTIRSTTTNYNKLMENLPDNLPMKKKNRSIDKTARDKISTSQNQRRGDCSTLQSMKDDKTSPISFIPILTLQEFENIPKYMKGRLQYDGVNGSIEEINAAIKEKYTFYRKGFQAMASIKDKERFKVMKSYETSETKGLYFVVLDDIKSASSLKTEAQRRCIFSILRHCHRIKEIRGPPQTIRYVVSA